MKKIRVIVVFIISSLIGAYALHAQSTIAFSDYRFNSISTSEGLLQSSVLSMVQDKNGFIWMGTKYGLNKYDGYKLDSYKHNSNDTNSLSSNEIINLLIDYNGDILIGTQGGRLNKYIYDKDVFEIVNGIPTNALVNVIFEDELQNLWVGTDLGLFRGALNLKTGDYKFENLTKGSIFCNAEGELIASNKLMYSAVSLLKESDNLYLVGTKNGLFCFDIHKKIFTEVYLDAINNAKVVTILKDSIGKIFVGSSEGLAVIDSSNNDAIITYYNSLQPPQRNLKISWINQIIFDHENNVWGGTRGGGLFKIDNNGDVTHFTSNNKDGYLRDNVINSLLIDKTGVLWVGTESRGCNTLDLHRKKFQHIEVENQSSSNDLNHQVTAITGNKKNTLWIGTAFNGINKIVKNENGKFMLESIEKIDVLSNMPTNEIIALHADAENNLWIGMAINSIVKIDNKNKISNISTEGFVFAIHEDKYGEIWYGTWGNGLGKINKKNNSVTRFASSSQNYQSLSNDIVQCIIDDSFDNLWVGTNGGGVNIAPMGNLDQGDGNFVSYVFDANEPTSLSNNDINCIYQANNGVIWIGTCDGLNKVIFPENERSYKSILQGNIKFESFHEHNGLPNNVICGILEDGKGNLWISTLDGLSKFNPETKIFKSYTMNDGLQANEFHNNGYYKCNNNELYFGGVNGVTVFNPDNIQPNPYLSKVVITSFKVFSNTVKPNQKIKDKVLLTRNITDTDSIKLSHKHKEFSIEFSGMHYSNTLNVKYAYRLLGFNDEWRETDKNIHSANYTNIYEGDYIFQVKATNNDGEWNQDIRELYITVLPPFWRRPVFYALYFLVILILLFFFRKYSLIAITEKNKLRIEALKRKKIIEITESKTRFFTNISHEIRTPLTLIFSPLERIFNHATLDDDTRASLKLVRKNVQRLLSLTDQLLQLRKLDVGIIEPQFENVSIVAYINDIIENFEQQAKRKAVTIKCSNNIENEEDCIWIDKEMITTALYNLLSNALKYSKGKGLIEVSLAKVNLSKNEFEKNNRKNIHADEYLMVEVSDNGIGIPSKDLNKIFHRFYQSEKASKAEHAGSGIGLSIVKGYIELHKGIIKATSKVSEGTIMKFYLPFGDKHFAASQKKEFKAIISKSNAHNIDYDIAEPVYINNNIDNKQKSKLLIVDDDSDMLSFLSNHFSAKYNVKTATDGKKAWCLIQKEMPDIVISDIMMPEIEGTELCNLIKAEIETSHIPVILLTAKAGNDNIIEGYEKGADRYISKPFSLNVLEAQVAQLIATRRQLIDLYSKKITLKPRDITITSTDEKFMTRLMDIIEENLSNPEFDVTQMVEKMHMSHSSVLKKIKALTDTSLVDFVRRHRLNKAAMIFDKQKMPVSEVAYLVGFSDPKYFSKCFSKQFGKTPTEFLVKPVL